MCRMNILHFSHSFGFVSIYCCCFRSASCLLQCVFSIFCWLRVRCVDLYIGMGLDSRPKICFALHVHTLHSHTHTHTPAILNTCNIVIILSIRVGLLFLDTVDVFIFVLIRFMPEGNNSMQYLLPVSLSLHFFVSHQRAVSCRHFLSLGQWCVANRGRERSPNAIDHKNDYPRSTNFMMETDILQSGEMLDVAV